MNAITWERFEELVDETMNNLPKQFYEFMDNVVVELAEEPTQQLLLEADFSQEEIEAGESLLGLFEPVKAVGSWAFDVDEPLMLMHRLWIFKKPHEEEFETIEQIEIEIKKTVIHELAHHFGLTDRDLERFDNTENPFRKKPK